MGGKLQQGGYWVAEADLDEIAGNGLSHFRSQLTGLERSGGEADIHLHRCDVVVKLDHFLGSVVDNGLLIDFLDIAQLRIEIQAETCGVNSLSKSPVG